MTRSSAKHDWDGSMERKKKQKQVKSASKNDLIRRR